MALPNSTMNQKSASQGTKELLEKEAQQQQQTSHSKEQAQDDEDFDPSAALSDDTDDEGTLEVEEAHGDVNEAKVQEEIDALKRESEMPIEELLAYYETMRQQNGDHEDAEDEEMEMDDENESDDDDDDNTFTSDDSNDD